MPYIHACEKCFKEFQTYYKSTRFCSKECFKNRHFRMSTDSILERQCSACKEWKAMSVENFFHYSKDTKGFHYNCKECAAKKNKTPEARIWQKKAKEKRAERIRVDGKKYRARPDVKARRNEYEKALKKSDPSFALKCRVRVLMYHSLHKTKNGRKWQDLVGYSINDLRYHIEKQFRDGMTWKQFMTGEIHIDHKIPVSAFNYEKPEDEDFKRCWAIENLQPLWAIDNLKKHNRVDNQFLGVF